MFSARTLPLALVVSLLVLTSLPPAVCTLAADDEVSATQPERKKKVRRPAAKRRTADPPLREIPVAVLPIGATREVKIDYLLEGEGVSEFGGRILGLVSCRARVELCLIKLPGRSISTIERGVGAAVDLTEILEMTTHSTCPSAKNRC